MDRTRNWFGNKAGVGLYAAGLYLIMAMAYLPFVGGMGYNYDDWEGVYLFTQGMSRADIWKYFVIDRPFSSLVHFVFYPILGTNVAAWHILAMSLLWGAIVFLVLSALRFFPNRVVPIAWSGVLLAVYPGITRLFVAFTTMPHYTSLFLFAFSLWAMPRALDEPNTVKRWMWWTVSWVYAFAQVFIIEYFVLMEAARWLVLLGFQWQREGGRLSWRTLTRSIWNWLPYGLILGAFLVFKFTILPQWAIASGTVSKHEVALFEELAGAPVATLAGFINLVLQDTVFQFGGVWLLPLSAKDLDVASKSYLVSWMVGAMGAGLAYGMTVYWLKKEVNKKCPSRWNMIWLAATFLVIIVLGGLPAWIIGRQGTVGLWSSRFFLAQVLGSVPLFVLLGMIFIGWKRPKAASVFFALLAMGGIAFQFREGNHYKLYWAAQSDYYWQLKERAPGLVEGAFIAAPATPFSRTSDYQIAYAIDLLYNADDPRPEAMNWWFDAPDDLLHKPTGTYKDRPIWGQMRNIKFNSTMAKALPVLYNPSRGCMQVLVDDYYLGEPLLTEQEQALFVLARGGLVLDSGSVPPQAVFGKQPKPNRCQYYQRVEKARVADNWQEIHRLWVNEISVDKNLWPTYGPEYKPIIESLARAGDWKGAGKLTMAAGKLTKEAKPFLCEAWRDRVLPLSDEDIGALDEWEKIQIEFGC